ncbi:glycine betaine ABC transporter substrate-binding protein [Radiobacillus sp. PE A8.2]|uniref:glycine betaine ABC transporter substrate-binding protein n=1 Tax=Radiobacillus sp. PE A8.2 TaxID=3380349 RepID=UPI00388DB7B8
MIKTKSLLKSAIFLMLLVALVACGNDQGEDGKETIVFGDSGWDSLRFHNEVARTIVEEGYGYPTEQTAGSSEMVWTAVREGDIDVHMEGWTKNLGDIYTEGIESGDFVKMSVNFDDSFQGFYVPRYVIEGDPERGIEPMAPDLEYVTDLPEYWELFQDPEDSSKGRIIGAISGWSVDEILFQAFEEYGLDETYNYFRAGSEAGINASLADAYEKGEPWIGYNYEPNWVLGKYDMVPLTEEDPEGILNNAANQDVNVVAHKSLLERAPEVAEFLKNYQTTSELANEALKYISDEGATPKEAAIKFLKEEEGIWTEWVPEDVADAVKESIQ